MLHYLAKPRRYVVNVLDPTGTCTGFEGVTVKITNSSGALLCETTTGPTGAYCCNINIFQFPVRICPEVSCPFEGSGLSIFDLVRIQRYILGFPYDDSDITKPYPPYYDYWADVNGDGKVTAQDLTVIRKIIRGEITGFNQCRIISKYCLDNYADPYEYDGFCLDGCQWVDLFSSAGSAEFNLSHIGDVDNTFEDPDCTKPFQQTDTEIRSILSTNTEHLVHRVNHDRTVTVGFSQSKHVNMLNLSV